MTPSDRPNPFAAGDWLVEAGWVFAMHSAQLWADPATAAGRLADLWAEKQDAFTEGCMGAGLAALRGASLYAITDAAVTPARHCVRTNAAKIRNG